MEPASKLSWDYEWRRLDEHQSVHGACDTGGGIGVDAMANLIISPHLATLYKLDESSTWMNWLSV